MRFLSHALLATLMGLGFCLQGAAADEPKGPAFSSTPELEQGYRLLYQQKFAEARQVFQNWADQNPTEPFGQVSLAATYLFEEFFLQHV
ncbi:MAG TPA: hypothetical protein VK703_16975, partial [Candidatus Acidoferrales bacterium]|nr:hypothetical protein [Candidatus Acidoferrales bacterium]